MWINHIRAKGQWPEKLKHTCSLAFQQWALYPTNIPWNMRIWQRSEFQCQSVFIVHVGSCKSLCTRLKGLFDGHSRWECTSGVERMLRWSMHHTYSTYTSLGRALTGMSPCVSPGFPRLTWEVPQAVQETAIDCGGANWVRWGGEWGAALASRWPEISRGQGSSRWPKSLCPAAAAADGSGRSERAVWSLLPIGKGQFQSQQRTK